jgi:uncharacterized protein YdaU (DUF1376 family)
MANKSPAFSFYADNYLGGTMRMPPLQRAAYMDLLANQWIGGAFDFATALLVCRGVPEADVKAVLEAKFVMADGKYLNSRLEKERERQETFRSKQSKNGKKGGRPKASENPNESQTKSNPNPTIKPNQSQTITQTQSQKKPSVSVSVSDLDSISDSESHPPTLQGDAGCAVADNLKIPKSLDTTGFRKAWESWIAFYKSAGKPLNPITGQFQLEHLARQGPDKAVRDLVLTMRSAREPGKIWDSDREGRSQSGTETKAKKRTWDK